MHSFVVILLFIFTYPIQGDGSDNSGRNTPQGSVSPKTGSPNPSSQQPGSKFSSPTPVSQISTSISQPNLNPSRFSGAGGVDPPTFSGVDESPCSGSGLEQMSPEERFKLLQYAEIMKRCFTGEELKILFLFPYFLSF